MSRLRFWRRRDETPVVELQRTNPVRFGLLLIVLIAIGVYFGFAKHVPGTHGYRLKAVFQSALNIEPKSPVRVAGIPVGTVSSVRRQGQTGVVTMELSNTALPIHSDATLKIRPRIFLEGNFFVELQPGSPSAPALQSGATIPITQTADPVQIDQLLTALKSDTRTDLQHLLEGYGEALTAKPSAAEDAEQQPEDRGIDGAQALARSYHLGPAALRGSAVVSQAVAGTEEHDISKLIAGLERVGSALNLDEQQLGEWVQSFDTFLGEFAHQSASLGAAVQKLPASLRSTRRGLAELDGALPSVKAFAKAIIPGVQQTPATIAAALPWIEQVKASLAPSELGGIAKGLQKAAPALARLTGTQASFQHQADLFSKCLTKVFFPAGDTKLQDGPNTSGVEDYKEFWYSMTGLAGIGQNFDGNGAATRFLIGGGGNTFLSTPATILTSEGAKGKGLPLVARSPLVPEGTRPAFPKSEPPFKPLVPCYTQPLPNFNGPLSSGPADGSGQE